MKSVGWMAGMLIINYYPTIAQVDTTYVYNTSTPYGTLDIRLAKSATRYYYLQEGNTFSFRESAGTKSNSYLDQTSWDSSPYEQGNLRERNGKYDYFIMNYRLLKPLGYKSDYNPGYPIIVMMHGAGERGNCWGNTCYHADRTWKPTTNNPAAPTESTSKLLNNDHNLLHGGKAHLDARNLAGTRLPNDVSMPGRAFPGFVLFPQNLNGWDANSVQDALRLIRLIAKRYNIDEDRIYIHGLSNGGSAVYQALKRAPWLFAAGLAMSAADDAGITAKNLSSSIAHVPLWIFQGGQDTNPTQRETEGYIRKFQEAGADVKYSLYPQLGHGTWNTAYAEGDFFKWILSQKKTRIHLFAGSSAICRTNNQGVRMELAKGFKAYQWEKNGVIISGANTSSYVATSTGTYRARFSRVASPTSTEWNEWSQSVTVTQQSPAQAQIAQIGTVLLKDLNNYGNARLRSVSESTSYFWYKDGQRVNLSGNVDDTVRNPIFYPGSCTSASCTGNGTYTLVTKTADGCPSPPSAPIYISFNNLSPVNITAPGDFKGSIISLTSVKLFWTDKASNERGFEIWRRNYTGSGYTKWEMRTITKPNVTSFSDIGLSPSTRYQYKIRAVSNNARSPYTPSASNAYLTIITNDDNSAPSAPQSLVAKTTGMGEIRLTWNASTDNTGIKQYRIYYGTSHVATGSASTNFTLRELDLNRNYSIHVKAEDLGGNLSAASNNVNASTFVNGLYYEHSTGSWTDLDQINWTAMPEFQGAVKNFTLAPRTQEDFFNFEFNGFINIKVAGSYKFRTTSSDGSRLQIGEVIVVNNDGVHGNRTITSTAQNLSSGAHRINLKYFEYDGSQTLVVQYYGPDTGNKWISVPDGALNSGSTPGISARTLTNDMAVVEGLNDSNFEIDIFPNPAPADNINISFRSDDSMQPVRVVVTDFTGRVVYDSNFSSEEWQEGLQISTNEPLQRGVYLLKVNQGSRNKMARLLIDR